MLGIDSYQLNCSKHPHSESNDLRIMFLPKERYMILAIDQIYLNNLTNIDRKNQINLSWF